MAVTVEESDSKKATAEAHFYEKINRILHNADMSDTAVQGGFTACLLLFCDFTTIGFLLRLLALWTLYKVHVNGPEAISLHVLLGLSYLLSVSIFSIPMALGITFWCFSFKMLQERLQVQLARSKRHVKLSSSFQLNLLIDALFKWGYIRLEEFLKNGRKRLGISDVITGKPLFIMNEIYTTEKTYIKNLLALKEVFQEPMQAILTYDDGFLKQQSVRIIFQNLKEILELHQKIFAEMDKDARNGQVTGENVAPFLIGKFTAEMIEYYGPYMTSFEKKTEELLQLQKNEKFSNFLTNQLSNEKCSGQPLDALLIRPVQRIPSLLLLYKDFQSALKKADSSHYNDVTMVVQQLNSVLSKLNYEKGVDEGRQKLLELATHIDNFPQQLVSSERIHQDSAMALVELDVSVGGYKLTKGKSRLNFYLMNDMIILTRQKQKSTGLMRNKKDIELYIGHIYLSSISEVFEVKEEGRFGLKYMEDDLNVCYLVVSFVINQESFLENLIRNGQNISKCFSAIRHYGAEEAKFKNSPAVRRRSKSTDRFANGMRNSINIEL